MNEWEKECEWLRKDKGERKKKKEGEKEWTRKEENEWEKKNVRMNERERNGKEKVRLEGFFKLVIFASHTRCLLKMGEGVSDPPQLAEFRSEYDMKYDPGH